MTPSYLVTQDGLLHQPSVAVQADPGIAPAPHFGDAGVGIGGRHDAAPDLLRGGGTPGCGCQRGLLAKHSVSVSSWAGAQQSEVGANRKDRI